MSTGRLGAGEGGKASPFLDVSTTKIGSFHLLVIATQLKKTSEWKKFKA